MKLLMLDLDDTVRRCTVPGRPTPHGAGEQELLPGAAERIREAQARGEAAAFVTNVGGVGLGLMTRAGWSAAMSELWRLLEAAGVETGPSRVSVHAAFGAPGESARRKPSPAMLLEAMRRWRVEPAEAGMVGDRPEDREAARRAGVRFLDAAAWRRGDAFPP